MIFITDVGKDGEAVSVTKEQLRARLDEAEQKQQESKRLIARLSREVEEQRDKLDEQEDELREKEGRIRGYARRIVELERQIQSNRRDEDQDEEDVQPVNISRSGAPRKDWGTLGRVG